MKPEERFEAGMQIGVKLPLNYSVLRFSLKCRYALTGHLHVWKMGGVNRGGG